MTLYHVPSVERNMTNAYSHIYRHWNNLGNLWEGRIFANKQFSIDKIKMNLKIYYSSLSW